MSEQTTDLEYTPITAPLPALVPVAELEALRSELNSLRRERDSLRVRLDAYRLTAFQANERANKLYADLDLCVGYLDAVLNGMSAQELMRLADVRDEVSERWGVGKKEKEVKE